METNQMLDPPKQCHTAGLLKKYQFLRVWEVKQDCAPCSDLHIFPHNTGCKKQYVKGVVCLNMQFYKTVGEHECPH